MSIAFPSLGVQCIKKKEIEEALLLRQEIRVDPFQSGSFIKPLFIFKFCQVQVQRKLGSWVHLELMVKLGHVTAIEG